MKSQVPSLFINAGKENKGQEHKKNEWDRGRVDTLPIVREKATCSLKIGWLTTEEAAIFLRLSVKALRNLTSNGKIPFYKLGHRNRYRAEELEALLLKESRGKQWV